MNSPVTGAPGIGWIAPIVLAVSFAASSPAAETPPLPPIDRESAPRKFDWMQISSGEWVKGEFDRLHDDKVYFDSDEFGDVTIDWVDVVSLVLIEPVTLRLIGPERSFFVGMLEMRNRKIHLETESGVLELQPEDVLGIITGTGKELDFWSGKASLGLAVRAGNTNQTDLSLTGSLRRQTVLTRFKAGYVGQFSTVDAAVTANSQRFSTTFDVFLTKRLFLTTPAFEYFADEFQNIGSRISVGSSLGYELVNNSMLLWEIGAGVAYQYTSFDSVSSGAPTANDAAVLANTSIEFDLPRGIEWDNSYKAQIVVTDMSKTNQHAESVLSFDIWGPLELDVTFIFDRVEAPVEDASGETPRSDDYRLTLGLGVDF